MVRVLLFVALLVAAPCGCLPYVLPPVRASVSGGGAWGRVAGSNQGQAAEWAETAVVQVRVEESPFQFLYSRFRRGYDLGFGYVGEFYRPPASSTFGKHGAYLRLQWFPWTGLAWPGRSKTALLRFGVYGMPELLVGRAGDAAEVGGGGTVGVSVEVAGFSRSVFDARTCAGWAYGENSVGVFVQGSYRNIHEREFWTATAGISVTLPASTGVCFMDSGPGNKRRSRRTRKVRRKRGQPRRKRQKAW